MSGILFFIFASCEPLNWKYKYRHNISHFEAPGYIGCFQNSDAAFEGAVGLGMHENMTIQMCIDLCQQHGKQYAGLHDGNKCTCFDDQPGDAVGNAECNTPCHGDQDDICGGRIDTTIDLGLNWYDRDRTSVYEGRFANIGQFKLHE